MLRVFIHQAAWRMDTGGTFSASKDVSMANSWANRLCREAADRAMQVGQQAPRGLAVSTDAAAGRVSPLRPAGTAAPSMQRSQGGKPEWTRWSC